MVEASPGQEDILQNKDTLLESAAWGSWSRDRPAENTEWVWDEP